MSLVLFLFFLLREEYDERVWHQENNLVFGGIKFTRASVGREKVSELLSICAREEEKGSDEGVNSKRRHGCVCV